MSGNPRFAISALKSFTQYDFIDRVKAHGIAFHEKTLGQLFCDGSAREIIAMLTDDMRDAGAQMELSTEHRSKWTSVHDREFRVRTNHGTWHCDSSLVVATGGKSIPKMGATGIGYDIARTIWPHSHRDPRRTGSVHLGIPHERELERIVRDFDRCARALQRRVFSRSAMLFTHRGLSGPAMLQISSYWRDGDRSRLTWRRGRICFQSETGADEPAQNVSLDRFARILPKRLVQHLESNFAQDRFRLADLGNTAIERIAAGSA
jgi:predicted flavoprotein YhiN